MAADEPVVIENWVRMRVLGSGGFGVVTLWKHKSTSQMIAVKRCRSELYPLMNPKQQERWEKEVDIMLRLNHNNVVKAMPVPEKALEDALRKGAACLPLLCMEFCSRGDLRQVLNKAENCCGLREKEVRNLIRDVAGAVEYLHSRKITHRDLKPENIVLQEAGDKIVYKLIDLGYAKELDQNSVCASFVGTLQYLAPELFMSQKYNHSVDYWSLGLVSHEVITGVRPFLPNMPPVTWMNLVQNKTSKDICACEDYDGNIIFSQELFNQNHISRCLKYYMEQWLQYCLEWDSKRRGKEFNENEEPRVVIFSKLSEILNKKIADVFCLPTYEVLSYEIDESTRLSTLQGWVEIDTRVPVVDQEVLSIYCHGRRPDPDGPALAPEFFKDDSKCGECVLFIFLRESFKTPQVTPTVPQLIQKMMQDPRRLIEYPLQKRTWANGVFFLKQEANLYQHLLHAYKVKMLNLFALYNNLSSAWQQLRAEYQNVYSQYELFSQSLKLDEKLFDEYSFKMGGNAAISNRICQGWRQDGETFSKKMSILVQVVNGQEKKCGAIAAKVSHFKSNPAPRETKFNALEPLVLAGQKCYEQLCRRPKETRHKKSDNVDMVKIVYGCLKERDKLLRDKAFETHLEKVIECQVEMEKSISLLMDSVDQVTKLKQELWSCQAKRQKDIWTLVDSSLRNDNIFVNYSQPPAKKLSFNATPPISKDPFHEMFLSLKDISVGDELVDVRKRSFASPNPSLEVQAPDYNATDMLSENYNLRSAMQDLMHETLDRVKSVVFEPIGDLTM